MITNSKEGLSCLENSSVNVKGAISEKIDFLILNWLIVLNNKDHSFQTIFPEPIYHCLA